MRKATSLKALTNKGRMSLEIAFEILTPEVQNAIPDSPIVVTIIPEIYTFLTESTRSHTMPVQDNST